MKRLKNISIILLSFIFLVCIMPEKTILAKDELKVHVRVEGINSTIAEGEASGSTVYETLTNLLDSKGIKYVMTDGYYGPYVSSINGLNEGSLGGYDGWMYVIKNGSVISDYMDLDDGCEVIFYYGEYGKTYMANKITFNPEVPKANEEVTMNIANITNDWTTGKDVITPLSDILVYIDDKEYITDEKGEIKITLTKGEHSYKFLDNNSSDEVPSVVSTKGTFTIDEVNAPTIIYSDEKYDKVNSDIENSIENADIDKTLLETLNYMSTNKVYQWGAFSLNKLGVKPKEAFLDSLIENLNYGVEEMTATELESAIIGLASIGYTPYDFCGVDLVQELYNRDINTFLNNDAIFALLVYRSLNIKGDYKITEADLVNKILSGYSDGWSWAGSGSDPDMTAAAISALSPYYNGKIIEGIDIDDVKTKVNAAVEILKNGQLSTGDIGGTYGPSSETDAFVILGLTSIGIDPSGEEFTKGNSNLVKAFLSYKGDNGAFNHNDSLKNNMYATENAFRALIALKEFNEKGIYDYYTSNIDLSALTVYKKTEDTTNKDEVNDGKKEDNKNESTTSPVASKNKTSKTSTKSKTADNNNLISLSLVSLGALFILIMVGIKKEGYENEN